MTVEILSIEKMKERIGQEIGVTDWLKIDQERINKFADCTLDRQWIHVDEEKAAKGPFGKTIAHGFLTVSLLSHFSEHFAIIPEGTKMTVNYGMNKVRLLNPVPVGSRIRDRITLSGIDVKSEDRILVTNTHTIEIEGKDKPACIAELLFMYFRG
ncbi:MAG: MaoC family dehydratase [Desulfobacteraceae bacterium]|nr:MAG: MaoC family dehydratase [Desulfobacteraceae bacterium]